MRLSNVDIKAFLELNGFKMNSLSKDHDYVLAETRKGLDFAISQRDDTVRLFWQTKKGESLLADKLPLVQQQFPAVQIEQGVRNEDWTRVYLPVDQEKPLVSSVELLNKTKGIVGY